MSNEVIYNIIKNKDYIIRPFLFKIIKENNLDINEILLLIYLTNQEHPELDLKLINKITTMSNEEIINSFNTLSEKGLISTNIIKDGDRIDEEISLDGIYKLAATNINKKIVKSQEKNIFELFESEFARPLTPMEFELINAWIESGINEDLIKEALKEATYNGVNNFRYIDKILYEWGKKGYKNIDDVNKNKMKKEERNDKKVSFFEYDWLDEN